MEEGVTRYYLASRRRMLSTTLANEDTEVEYRMSERSKVGYRRKV